MKRYLQILNGFTPLLILLIFQSILLLGFTSIYTAIMGGQRPSSELNYYMKVIVVIVSGIVAWFWYRQNYGSDNLRILHSNIKIKDIGLFLLLGIVSQFFASSMIALISPLIVKQLDIYKQTIDRIFAGHPAVACLYIIIIAPIVEEIFFRGILLERSKGILPFLGANIIQAAAFGIFHGNILQGLFTFGIGLILGSVMEKYKNLWAAILLHMALNGSSYLVAYVPNHYGFITGIAVISGGLLYWILRRLQDAYEKEN